jgi:hypothetical protein
VLVSVSALRAISAFCFKGDGCPCVWCRYVKDWYFLLMSCSFH